MKHIDKVRRAYAATQSGESNGFQGQDLAQLGKQMGGVLSYVAELERRIVELEATVTELETSNFFYQNAISATAKKSGGEVASE